MNCVCSRHAGSLTEALTQAVGPDFAWLCIERSQSRCRVCAGPHTFPPIVLPVGFEPLIEACATATGTSPAKALAFLCEGALLTNAACRRAAQPALKPLVERVREVLEGMAREGRLIRTLIWDLPDADIPGLPQTFRELWPEQKVLPLRSLRITSRAGTLTDEPVFWKADTHWRPAAVEPWPLEGRESELSPYGSAFLAWLAVLAVSGFVGLGAYHFHTIAQVQKDLASVTRKLERIPHDQLVKLPAAPARKRTKLPPDRVGLPPMPAVAALAPSRVPSRLSRERPPFRPALVSPGVPVPGPRRSSDEPPTIQAPARRARPEPRLHSGDGASPAGAAPLPALARALTGQHLLPDGASPAGALLPALAVPNPSREALTPIAAPVEPGERGTLAASPSTPETAAPEPPSLPMAPMTPLAARMTLLDVLKQAGEHSPVVQAARWRLAALESRRISDELPYRFRGSLEGVYFNTSCLPALQSGVGSPPTGAVGSLEIDIAGRRKALKQAAEAVHDQGSAAAEAAREEACYGAALAYLEALQAQVEVSARQEILTAQREQWRVARVRLATGYGSRPDLAQVESRVASAQSELASVMTRQELAELRLGAAVRATAGSRVQPDPSDLWLAARTARLASQPAEALASAHMQVREAAARVEERRALLELAKKSKRPRLSAYSGIGFFGTGVSHPDALIGLRLSVPFADGGASEAAIRQAQAALAEATALYQQAREATTAEITAAQVELKRTQERLDSTSPASAAAREAVRAAQSRYEAGYATVADVLQAQAGLSAVLLDSAEVLGPAFRAQLNLVRATGQFKTLCAAGMEER